MPGWMESEMPNHQEYGLKCFMFHVSCFMSHVSCLMDLSRMFVADTLTFLYVVLANTRGGNPSWIWTLSWQGPPPISGSRTTLTPVGTETIHLSDTFHNESSS